MLLGNATRGRLVARSVVTAPDGWRRLGMLRRGGPGPGVAIRFRGPAFWVPFRRAPVDLVFVDAAMRVVAVIEGLHSWRGAGPFQGAVEGVVLEAGACSRAAIQHGDQLEFTPTTSERIAAGAKPPLTF